MGLPCTDLDLNHGFPALQFPRINAERGLIKTCFRKYDSFLANKESVTHVENIIIAGQSLGWLLAAAIDAVLIADAKGQIVLANPAAHRVFGYGEGSLVGLSIDQLVPERLRHAHGAQRADYNAHPRPRQMGAGTALYARHRDGSEFPVEVSLSPLHDPGKPLLVMATVHDIRLRKQAELALLESEERARAVFETAVDAIITIDEGGIMDRLNGAAVRMFGYTEAEAVGKNVSMLMPEPHHGQHDGYLAHYLQTG